MQEIYPNIYIETGYAGVTLGALNLKHGLILIDAPFLPDDIRTWRSSLVNMGGGIDRLLINLDAHIDRIMGARAMECTVVGHEDLALIFQTRPFAYRSQSIETGAEWESYDNLGTIRWAPPELTFTHEMNIHWGDTPIILEQRPGAELGALSVHLPEQHVLFLGDLVMPNQPPFLANAHIPTWLETLNGLLDPKFQDYILIGGRTGLIRREHVCWQIQFLEKIQAQLEKLKDMHAPESEIANIFPKLISEIVFPVNMNALYQRRLRWGLSTYYLKNYFPENFKHIEE